MRYLFLLFLPIVSFAQLGQMPAGGVRVYYHAENTNDATANAINLTNNNSVSFSAARFANGFDMGSSGTNKGMTVSSNPFSSSTPDKVYVSFWVKMNSTADHSGAFTILSSDISTTGGRVYQLLYSITSGVLTLQLLRNISGGTTGPTNGTWSPTTTDWYFIEFYYDSSVPVFTYSVWNANMSLIVSNTSTSSTGGASTVGGSRYLSIGNNRGLTNQCRCIIDEYIMSETFFVESSSSSNRVKHRTQSVGKNVN